MEKKRKDLYLIQAQLKDISLLDFVEKTKGEVIERRNVLDTTYIRIIAIVTGEALSALEEKDTITIENKEDLYELSRVQQKLVGTGNRYLIK